MYTPYTALLLFKSGFIIQTFLSDEMQRYSLERLDEMKGEPTVSLSRNMIAIHFFFIEKVTFSAMI